MVVAVLVFLKVVLVKAIAVLMAWRVVAILMEEVVKVVVEVVYEAVVIKVVIIIDVEEIAEIV